MNFNPDEYVNNGDYMTYDKSLAYTYPSYKPSSLSGGAPLNLYPKSGCIWYSAQRIGFPPLRLICKKDCMPIWPEY